MDLEHWIRGLNHYDESTLAALRKFVQEQVSEGIGTIRKLLDSTDLRDDAALASYLLTLHVEHAGPGKTEAWLYDEWHTSSTSIRRRITSTLQDASLLSADFAKRLFRSPVSTVGDRHRIVAGLAATARARKCEQLIMELVSEIGRYDDGDRQRVLEKFVADVRTNFRNP